MVGHGNLVSKLHAEHGDIVLMHDSHSFAATAAALAGTLPNWTDAKFCHVSSWLRDSREDARKTTQANRG